MLMIKISRLDAFSEIIKATENNETNKANQMMAIVAKSIENDKKNNTFSVVVSVLTAPFPAHCKHPGIELLLSTARKHRWKY